MSLTNTTYRAELGPDLIIVVLSMSKEDRRERVLRRHQGNVDIADKLDVRQLSPTMGKERKRKLIHFRI